MKTLVKLIIILLVCFAANVVCAAECAEVNNQISAIKNKPAELRKLLDSHPACGEIWKALGDYFYAREVWDESYKHYEGAHKLLPEDSKVTRRLQELRPKLTTLLENEEDMLKFRRQIGGTTRQPPEANQAPEEVLPEAASSSRAATTSNVSQPSPPSTAPSAGGKTTKPKPAKVASLPQHETLSLPKGQKVGVMVNFEFNSAEIMPDGRKLLDNFADILNKELAGKKFYIMGHTDNIGSRKYNLELSQRRAQSVKNYLSSAGVDTSKMEVLGFGFDKPIYDNDTEAGRSKNRRVEFEIR